MVERVGHDLEELLPRHPLAAVPGDQLLPRLRLAVCDVSDHLVTEQPEPPVVRRRVDLVPAVRRAGAPRCCASNADSLCTLIPGSPSAVVTSSSPVTAAVMRDCLYSVRRSIERCTAASRRRLDSRPLGSVASISHLRSAARRGTDGSRTLLDGQDALSWSDRSRPRHAIAGAATVKPRSVGSRSGAARSVRVATCSVADCIGQYGPSAQCRLDQAAAAVTVSDVTVRTTRRRPSSSQVVDQSADVVSRPEAPPWCTLGCRRIDALAESVRTRRESAVASTHCQPASD